MNSALHILNVDDNEAARYVRRRVLTAAGHTVTDAASGSDALAALREGLPHVALIDMKLPDMTGFELTRRIRSDPRTAALGIIQVSAICVTRDDERDGLESGADAYLVDPLDWDELLTSVKQVFKSRSMDGNGSAREKAVHEPVRRAEAFIRENFRKQISLDDIARAAKLSPYHFVRVFKAAVGTTPHDFLVRVRIQEAMTLLAQTTQPIGEVARTAGFPNQAHFASVFRGKAGCTPSQFRQARKREAAA